MYDFSTHKKHRYLLAKQKDSNEKKNRKEKKISHKFMRIHKKLLGIHPTFSVFCYRTIKKSLLLRF